MTESNTHIEVSYLRQTYYCKHRTETVLHQSRITDVEGYEDFASFVHGFLDLATYPRPVTSKMETYGWTPVLFEPSINHHGEDGVWRDGQFANDELTLFVADLDNQNADRTIIDLGDVADTLTDLGLSHLLYTSFTSRPERPKFRIVIPVTRPLTCDEAFTVFEWFNAAFDRQLDGSIYDPGDHLYGPTATSTVVIKTDGQSLDVDRFIAMTAELPEELRTRRRRDAHPVARAEATPEEREAMTRLAATLTRTDGVSIRNPQVFNPAWLDLMAERYIEQSHSQTAFGLLTKAWMKSGGTLSRGDLEYLYEEIDAEFYGYLSRNYGRHERDRGISSIMRRPVPVLDKTTALERRVSSLTRRLGLN